MGIVRVYLLLAFTVTISTNLLAQKMESISGPGDGKTLAPVLATNPISISLETGRYDPKPDCNKVVDGCFPKVWTTTNKFKAGERVWVRATVTNHSDMEATDWVTYEFSRFAILIHENATGAEPKLTHRGCLLTQSASCPPSNDFLVFNGFEGYEHIKPHESVTVIEEVTEDFDLTGAKSYSVAVGSGGYNLSPMGDLVDIWFRDVKAVKRSGALKSMAVEFTIDQ